MDNNKEVYTLWIFT